MLESYEKAKESAISYLNRCASAARQMKNTEIAKQLEQCILEIRALRFNIAVVGDIKRGKSTLINTLLGQENDDLSPIGSAVCTGCITHYMDVSCLDEPDRKPHARVYKYGSSEPENVDLFDIEDYITESGNPDNCLNVARVEVYGHFPLLHSCCLVDTPGANAVIERHGEIVNAFLPNADAIIMTIMADQPMTASEAQMVQNLSQDEQRRIFYILTQIDTQRPADLPSICTYISDTIAKRGLRRPDRIYQVACKPVFEAQCNHSPQGEIDSLRKQWGVASLEKELEQFILQSSNSGKMLVRRVSEAMATAGNFFEQKRTANLELVKLHDTDAEQMHKEKERILEELRSMEKRISRNIEQFEKEWDRLTEKAVHRLPDIKDELELRITNTINSAGLLQSITNAFSLGNLVAKAAKAPVEDYLEKVAARYNKLVTKLDEDIQEDVELFLKMTRSGSLVSGGGTVAIASAAAISINSAWGAGQAIFAAYSTWVAAATTASATAAQPGFWGTIAGWFGYGQVASTAAASTNAGAVLVSTLSTAIVPVIIAIVAMKLTGPLVKFVSKLPVSGKVDDLLKKAGDDLRAMAGKNKETFLAELRDKLETMKADVENKLADIDDKIRRHDPAIKEQALLENQEVDKLLELGSRTSEEIRCIQ